MKRLLSFLAIFGMLTIGMSFNALAQDEKATETTPDSTKVEATTEVTEEVETETVDPNATEEVTAHQVIKIKFIEGGAGFMGIVLLTFILGLAVAIEKIIYLNLADGNNAKLLEKIETALKDGGVDAAKEVCRSTRGPVASIFYQGLDRYDESIEMVEKSVVAYGSVQVGKLESGMSWLSLMILIAPMLGFLGTVVGMIEAFDAIQVAGDITPTLVAGGIKVALITTVGGLIVAIILQIFYNYIIAKIDTIVNKMDDASISLIDILVKNQPK